MFGSTATSRLFVLPDPGPLTPESPESAGTSIFTYAENAWKVVSAQITRPPIRNR